MIKWLFFDLGSTLIDERECDEYRLQDLLRQENAPGREVLEQRIMENVARGGSPYRHTVRDLGMKGMDWPQHLEKLYEGVPEVLEELHGRYHLGVIANQSPGTEERLVKFGIRQYFDVILSSAEEGVEKPNMEIFRRALKRTACMPEEAYMIGDRLDNDIEPAAGLGMHTIWVKQAMYACADLNSICCKPDTIVECVGDLLQHI